MPTRSNVRTRKLSDPVALRALAHPVRMRLHALVAREGSLTAADAARQLGISHALASHHLRQLAKYGFVEPAPAADSREHPWQVTATSMAFEPRDPGAWAPNDLIQRQLVERAGGELEAWQRQRPAEPDQRWALAGAFDSLLYLDAAEFQEVLRAWGEIVRPFAEARPIGHAEARPPRTRPVGFTLVAVPLTPTEQGG